MPVSSLMMGNGRGHPACSGKVSRPVLHLHNCNPKNENAPQVEVAAAHRATTSLPAYSALLSCSRSCRRVFLFCAAAGVQITIIHGALAAAASSQQRRAIAVHGGRRDGTGIASAVLAAPQQDLQSDHIMTSTPAGGAAQFISSNAVTAASANLISSIEDHSAKRATYSALLANDLRALRDSLSEDALEVLVRRSRTWSQAEVDVLADALEGDSLKSAMTDTTLGLDPLANLHEYTREWLKGNAERMNEDEALVRATRGETSSLKAFIRPTKEFIMDEHVRTRVSESLPKGTASQPGPDQTLQRVTRIFKKDKRRDRLVPQAQEITEGPAARGGVEYRSSADETFLNLWPAEVKAADSAADEDKADPSTNNPALIARLAIEKHSTEEEVVVALQGSMEFRDELLTRLLTVPVVDEQLSLWAHMGLDKYFSHGHMEGINGFGAYQTSGRKTDQARALSSVHGSNTKYPMFLPSAARNLADAYSDRQVSLESQKFDKVGGYAFLNAAALAVRKGDRQKAKTLFHTLRELKWAGALALPFESGTSAAAATCRADHESGQKTKSYVELWKNSNTCARTAELGNEKIHGLYDAQEDIANLFRTYRQELRRSRAFALEDVDRLPKVVSEALLPLLQRPLANAATLRQLQREHVSNLLISPIFWRLALFADFLGVDFCPAEPLTFCPLHGRPQKHLPPTEVVGPRQHLQVIQVFAPSLDRLDEVNDDKNELLFANTLLDDSDFLLQSLTPAPDDSSEPFGRSAGAPPREEGSSPQRSQDGQTSPQVTIKGDFAAMAQRWQTHWIDDVAYTQTAFFDEHLDSTRNGNFQALTVRDPAPRKTTEQPPTGAAKLFEEFAKYALGRWHFWQELEHQESAPSGGRRSSGGKLVAASGVATPAKPERLYAQEPRPYFRLTMRPALLAEELTRFLFPALFWDVPAYVDKMRHAGHRRGFFALFPEGGRSLSTTEARVAELMQLRVARKLKEKVILPIVASVGDVLRIALLEPSGPSTKGLSFFSEGLYPQEVLCLTWASVVFLELFQLSSDLIHTVVLQKIQEQMAAIRKAGPPAGSKKRDASVLLPMLVKLATDGIEAAFETKQNRESGVPMAGRDLFEPSNHKDKDVPPLAVSVLELKENRLRLMHDHARLLISRKDRLLAAFEYLESNTPEKFLFPNRAAKLSNPPENYVAKFVKPRQEMWKQVFAKEEYQKLISGEDVSKFEELEWHLLDLQFYAARLGVLTKKALLSRVATAQGRGRSAALSAGLKEEFVLKLLRQVETDSVAHLMHGRPIVTVDGNLCFSALAEMLAEDKNAEGAATQDGFPTARELQPHAFVTDIMQLWQTWERRASLFANQCSLLADLQKASLALGLPVRVAAASSSSSSHPMPIVKISATASKKKGEFASDDGVTARKKRAAALAADAKAKLDKILDSHNLHATELLCREAETLSQHATSHLGALRNTVAELMQEQLATSPGARKEVEGPARKFYSTGVLSMITLLSREINTMRTSVIARQQGLRTQTSGRFEQEKEKQAKRLKEEGYDIFFEAASSEQEGPIPERQDGAVSILPKDRDRVEGDFVTQNAGFFDALQQGPQSAAASSGLNSSTAGSGGATAIGTDSTPAAKLPSKGGAKTRTQQERRAAAKKPRAPSPARSARSVDDPVMRVFSEAEALQMTKDEEEERLQEDLKKQADHLKQQRQKEVEMDMRRKMREAALESVRSEQEEARQREAEEARAGEAERARVEAHVQMLRRARKGKSSEKSRSRHRSKSGKRRSASRVRSAAPLSAAQAQRPDVDLGDQTPLSRGRAERGPRRREDRASSSVASRRAQSRSGGKKDKKLLRSRSRSSSRQGSTGRRSTSLAGDRAASRGKQRDPRRIRSASANYARNRSKTESSGSGSSEQDAQLVPSGGASSSVKSVFGYDPQKGLIKLADIFDAVVRPGDDSSSPEDEDEDVAPRYFAAQDEEHHEDPPYASAAASRPGTPGSYGFYSGASEFGAASSTPAGRAAYIDFSQHQQDQEAGAAGNDVYIDIEVLEVALEDSHPETVQRALEKTHFAMRVKNAIESARALGTPDQTIMRNLRLFLEQQAQDATPLPQIPESREPLLRSTGDENASPVPVLKAGELNSIVCTIVTRFNLVRQGSLDLSIKRVIKVPIRLEARKTQNAALKTDRAFLENFNAEQDNFLDYLHFGQPYDAMSAKVLAKNFLEEKIFQRQAQAALR
ncbi:unnamed protein product, partial [Amoebophrya sp. A120]|eukprot:GSA120T00022252001.1